MYVCMYVCTYVRTYVCIFVLYICIGVWMDGSNYVCNLHEGMFVSKFVCIFVCMYLAFARAVPSTLALRTPVHAFML
jgi:hypothetical protein